MLTIFDKIPQLAEIPATLLPYDNTVQKNVNTVFEYPAPKDAFVPEPNLFYSNKDWNKNIDLVYENLNYLNSQSKLWNPYIPGIKQNEILSGLPGYHVLQEGNGTLHLANDTTIQFVSGGEVIQTLDCSPLDNFFKIKEIKITEDRLYLIDRNLIFVWEFPSFKFEGFFGGYGGPSEKTRFNNPCSVTANVNYIFVADTDNSSIKIYDCNFQFIFRAILPFKPQAIEVNENYLFVAGKSRKIYRFDLHDFRCFNVFDLPFTDVTKIRNDNYQDGFLYIINSSGAAIKYTQDGLVVGTFRNLGANIVDVDKVGTTLYVYMEDGTVNSYLDHSFIFNILSEQCEFTPSAAYVKDAELNPSYLAYNKSLERIYEDLLCYADSITGSFVNIVTEFQDEKVGVEIQPISCYLPPELGKETFFGQGDPFVWEIAKRPWERICEGLVDLSNCYKFGTSNPPKGQFGCLPISALRIDKPQKPSENAFPLTVKEIQPQFNKFNLEIFGGDDCNKNWCDLECFLGNETSACSTWDDIAEFCDVVCMSAVRWKDFDCPAKTLPCLVNIFEPTSACSAIIIENNGDRQNLEWDSISSRYQGDTLSLRWEMDRWNLYSNEVKQKEMANNLFNPSDKWTNTDDCILMCDDGVGFICYSQIQISDICGRLDILDRVEIISSGETACQYEGANWTLQFNTELGYWDLSSKENGDIWAYPITKEYMALNINPTILDPLNDMTFTIHGSRSRSFNLPKDMTVTVL